MSDTEKESVSEAPKEDVLVKVETSGGGDIKQEAAENRMSPDPSPVKFSPKKSSPKKSPMKVKKEEEEEDKDYESEGEEYLGILDKPVVIQQGKRERKKTERMSYEKVVTPEKKTLEIPEGRGIKLGDCPRIEHMLGKTKSADCKTLHKILFSRAGTALEVKKNIRKFFGFTFEKDSPEYEKKRAQVAKLFTAPLKDVCTILDIHRGGTKDEVINRIMDFLLKPEDSGRALPKSKRKPKTESKKRKRKSKSSSSANVSASPDGSDGEDEAEDVDGDDEDEGGIDNEHEAKSSDSDGEEAEVEEPQPKKQKVETPKRGRPKKDQSAKKAKVAKKEKKEKKSVPPKKRKVSVSEDSDSDDEPLVKKKSPPTDDDLRDVVKKILDGANLEEVTMKTVLKKVYDKFPEYDLADRKDFIKTTVKEIIS